jgi:hypothetical protein
MMPGAAVIRKEIFLTPQRGWAILPGKAGVWIKKHGANAHFYL